MQNSITYREKGTKKYSNLFLRQNLVIQPIINNLLGIIILSLLGILLVG